MFKFFIKCIASYIVAKVMEMEVWNRIGPDYHQFIFFTTLFTVMGIFFMGKK